MCVLQRGWQSTAASTFSQDQSLHSTRVTPMKKKEYKRNYELHGELSCETVFTERLIPSASIPRPPELRSVQVWTKRALRGKVNRTVRWEPDVWACERSREKLRILSCFGAWREQPMSPECVGRIESPCVCSIRGGNKAERSASHLKS